MNYGQVEIQNKTSSNRLELEIEGSTAFIDYKLSHHTLFLVHTEVPPALEGKGVGKAIVEKTLQYAKSHQYKIVPLCTFVQLYLKRHPEWSDIVSPDADRFITQQK